MKGFTRLTFNKYFLFDICLYNAKKEENISIISTRYRKKIRTQLGSYKTVMFRQLTSPGMQFNNADEQMRQITAYIHKWVYLTKNSIRWQGRQQLQVKDEKITYRYYLIKRQELHNIDHLKLCHSKNNFVSKNNEYICTEIINGCNKLRDTNKGNKHIWG